MSALFSNKVKTRKPHQCWGCAGDFPVGSIMVAVTNEDGGKLIKSYWCEVCNAYWQAHFENGDEIFMGDFKHEPHYKEYKEKFLNNV